MKHAAFFFFQNSTFTLTEFQFLLQGIPVSFKYHSELLLFQDEKKGSIEHLAQTQDVHCISDDDERSDFVTKECQSVGNVIYNDRRKPDQHEGQKESLEVAGTLVDSRLPLVAGLVCIGGLAWGHVGYGSRLVSSNTDYPHIQAKDD